MRLPPDLALPDLGHCEAASSILQQDQQDFPTPGGGRQQQQQQPFVPSSPAAADAGGDASSNICSYQQGTAALACSGQESSSQGHRGTSSNSGSSSISRHGRNTPAGGERVSLFRPVRKYHGKAESNGRVSTLEAVAAALLALEGDEGMYEGLLHNLKLKVDAMRAQKRMPPVYGVSSCSQEEEDCL